MYNRTGTKGINLNKGNIPGRQLPYEMNRCEKHKYSVQYVPATYVNLFNRVLTSSYDHDGTLALAEAKMSELQTFMKRFQAELKVKTDASVTKVVELVNKKLWLPFQEEMKSTNFCLNKLGQV